MSVRSNLRILCLRGDWCQKRKSTRELAKDRGRQQESLKSVLPELRVEPVTRNEIVALMSAKELKTLQFSKIRL